jgi:hypothetical protein
VRDEATGAAAAGGAAAGRAAAASVHCRAVMGRCSVLDDTKAVHTHVVVASMC